MVQPLLTPSQREQLLAYGCRTAQGEEIAPPVVTLFMLEGAGTWLLTALDPTEPTRAFGVCDPGLVSPELGYVCLLELAAIRGRLRLPFEFDSHFRADRPLSAYVLPNYRSPAARPYPRVPPHTGYAALAERRNSRTLPYSSSPAADSGKPRPRPPSLHE